MAIRRLLIQEARHDNGWIYIVAEQPDGTLVAWAGPGTAIGVDYIEDTPSTGRRVPCLLSIARAVTPIAQRVVPDWHMCTRRVAGCAPR